MNASSMLMILMNVMISDCVSIMMSCREIDENNLVVDALSVQFNEIRRI